MIGRLHHVIVDCPDPAGLAAFYSALPGLPVTYQEDDFAVVAVNGTTSGIAFQRVAGYHPPRWPDPAHPPQLRFDVMVDAAGRGRVRRPRRAPVLPDSPARLGASGRGLTLPQG